MMLAILTVFLSLLAGALCIALIVAITAIILLGAIALACIEALFQGWD